MNQIISIDDSIPEYMPIYLFKYEIVYEFNGNWLPLTIVISETDVSADA